MKAVKIVQITCHGHDHPDQLYSINFLQQNL